MKVLYIAGFQGPELIKRRHITRNRSLAGTAKMRAITAALLENGCDVTIYSVGTAAERSGKLYGSFKEDINFSGGTVRVYYGSCIDLPVLNRYSTALSMFLNLPKICKSQHFDVAIVYNCDIDAMAAAFCCRCVNKIPIVLEYEDSVVIRRIGRASLLRRARRINELAMRRAISVVIAVTPELAEAIGHDNNLVLPGALSEDLVAASKTRPQHSAVGERLKVLYCGNLDLSKGVDLLMDAVELIEYPLELHICGKGPQEKEIRSRCAQCRHPAYFHGVVSRSELVSLQTSADIAVNPHRVSWHKGTLWPFKVIEYLAACGVVVSSKTGKIEKDLEKYLHLYRSDDPSILASEIARVIDNWENERNCVRQRMAWAVKKWGPEGIGPMIASLLQKVVSRNLAQHKK